MRGRPTGGRLATSKETCVIVLGVILLIIGFVAAVHIIWIIGIVAVVIGAILFLLGATGREVAGRKHWF
jgi:uncharacterized membrane protein HdeD (DUF308 family)